MDLNCGKTILDWILDISAKVQAQLKEKSSSILNTTSQASLFFSSYQFDILLVFFCIWVLVWFLVFGFVFLFVCLFFPISFICYLDVLLTVSSAFCLFVCFNLRFQSLLVAQTTISLHYHMDWEVQPQRWGGPAQLLLHEPVFTDPTLDPVPLPSLLVTGFPLLRLNRQFDTLHS